MAEYIEREKLIKRLHNAEENYKADHDYEVDDDSFSDGILSAMFCVNQIIGTEPTADVIERSKIDKAKKQITDSMNEHLASDGTPIDEYAYCYLNVLEILEENIGE